MDFGFDFTLGFDMLRHSGDAGALSAPARDGCGGAAARFIPVPTAPRRHRLLLLRLLLLLLLRLLLLLGLLLLSRLLSLWHLPLLPALDLASRLAGRAPEPGAAVEAPMSERSEFGRRAAS
ncbi:hypothetical protein PQS31_14965, partial [Luteimonas sp BLCC-B24]|uniref:hypothetical protein n=1 Tax=Luteimonas sp. BLCC-B24 TaxID=3025317 RepID=UPI00234DBDD9